MYQNILILLNSTLPISTALIHLINFLLSDGRRQVTRHRIPLPSLSILPHHVLSRGQKLASLTVGRLYHTTTNKQNAMHIHTCRDVTSDDRVARPKGTSARKWAWSSDSPHWSRGWQRETIAPAHLYYLYTTTQQQQHFNPSLTETVGVRSCHCLFFSFVRSFRCGVFAARGGVGSIKPYNWVIVRKLDDLILCFSFVCNQHLC